MATRVGHGDAPGAKATDIGMPRRTDVAEDLLEWFSECTVKAHSLVEKNIRRKGVITRRVIFPFEIGIHVFTMIRAI